MDTTVVRPTISGCILPSVLKIDYRKIDHGSHFSYHHSIIYRLYYWKPTDYPQLVTIFVLPSPKMANDD